MQIVFTLTMDDAIVDGQRYDHIIFSWLETVSQECLLAISNEWLASDNYLTKKMIGLERVGESSLEVTSIEERTSFF